MRSGLRPKTLGAIPGQEGVLNHIANQDPMVSSIHTLAKQSLPQQTSLGMEGQMQLHSQNSVELEKSVDRRRRGSNTSSNPVATVADTHNILAPCVYIGLLCSRCGDLRQALSRPPVSDTAVCPECGVACSFVLLGTGLTRRRLPFHEIRWNEKQVPTSAHRIEELSGRARPRPG